MASAKPATLASQPQQHPHEQRRTRRTNDRGQRGAVIARMDMEVERGAVDDEEDEDDFAPRFLSGDDE